MIVFLIKITINYNFHSSKNTISKVLIIILGFCHTTDKIIGIFVNWNLLLYDEQKNAYSLVRKLIQSWMLHLKLHLSNFTSIVLGT